jgi:uncharacterized protein YggE
MKRVALIAVPLVALAAVVAVVRPGGAHAVDPQPSATATAPRSITVTGTGAVRSVPDRAQVSFGVETRATTARGASQANASELRRVIDAVKRAGGQDVGTSSVSLYPQSGDDGEVTGYVAQNTVTATLNLGKTGAAIDAAVAAGANQVYGPSLSASDAAALYRQALTAAVADARARAETLARAAGAELGAVTAIVESSSAPTPLYAAAKASADESTPIEAGTQETSASVSLTFTLE